MFGLFLSYCILYVLDHILSCHTGFLDLENVCLDTKNVFSMIRSWDIAGFHKKIVAILKIQDGSHKVLEKM